MYTQEQQEFFRWLEQGDNAQKFDTLTQNQQPAEAWNFSPAKLMAEDARQEYGLPPSTFVNNNPPQGMMQPEQPPGVVPPPGVVQPASTFVNNNPQQPPGMVQPEDELVVGGGFLRPEQPPGMLQPEPNPQPEQPPVSWTPEQEQWFADNDWFVQPEGLETWTPGQQFAEIVIQNVNANGLDQLTPEQQAKYKEAYYNEDLSASQRMRVFESGWTKDERIAEYGAPPSRDPESGNWQPSFDSNDPNFDPAAAASYATLRLNDTRGIGKNNQKVDEISQWFTDIRNISRHHPEQMAQWVSENPEDAIRFYALNATPYWNGADDKETRKEHQKIADTLAYLHALELGYGEDGKQDGKMIASDFKTFNDLTSEGGPGDIWKLGTPNSLPGGINDFLEDNPFQALSMVGLAIAAPYASSALVGAGFTAAQAGMIVGSGGAALQAAFSGQSFEDIVKSGLVGGVTGAVGAGFLDDYLPAGYSADNFAGAFVKGGVNDVIEQAITTGDVDLMKALQAAGYSSLIATAKDVGQDVVQTNDNGAFIDEDGNVLDGNLRVGRDTVNGIDITQEQVNKLTNTSDLYGLLGENGFLDKIGIDVDYMPTDFIGDVADFLGMGGRPVHDPGGIIQEAAQKELDGIAADESLTYAEKNQQIENVVNGFYRDTAPYDERFFDLTTDRGNTQFTGIYTENPISSGGSVPSIPGGGEGGNGGGLPSSPDVPTLPGGGFEDPNLPSNEDILAGDPVLGGDDDLLEGTLPDAPTLPGGGIDDPELPTAPPDYGYRPEEDNLPGDPVGETQQPTLPGGGGGGGSVTQPLEQMMGAIGSKEPNLLDMFKGPEFRALPYNIQVQLAQTLASKLTRTTR